MVLIQLFLFSILKFFNLLHELSYDFGITSIEVLVEHCFYIFGMILDEQDCIEYN